MPREVRIEFSGATYHVMCRGDRREEIFRDDGDREMMLATLAETVEKTGWQVHAWVWMSSHYHLLVETPGANLVKGMTWFQTTCTTRFNARHHQRGHLFCLRSQSRKNYHGDEIKAHGESDARALLAAGLAGAGGPPCRWRGSLIVSIWARHPTSPMPVAANPGSVCHESSPSDLFFLF